MPTRLFVRFRVPDARARNKLQAFSNLHLSGQIREVFLIDCFAIDKSLDAKQLSLAKKLLHNPLLQEVFDTAPAPKNFDYAIEVGFLPGVTDNVGNTAKETLEDGLKIKFKNGESVYTSQLIFIVGKISGRDAKIIADSLYNPLIQRVTIKSFAQYQKSGGMNAVLPKVELVAETKVLKVDLNVSDEELIKLGKMGIKEPLNPHPQPLSQRERGEAQRRGPLALGLDELKAIREYFKKQKRKPTDIELETLAQTWSEHCKHTIFADPLDEVEKGLFKTYIKGATDTVRKNKGKRDFCVSVFTDNSGAIEFDNDYLITHKVETHNSPSALDPFGGAITGIVGVNRDTLGFGMGAKPIINVYAFCLADPGSKTELYRDADKKQKMLSARRIMDGVVAGINAGGNQSGIPTNLGLVYFDPRYRGKPLVFAGTVGLIPKKIGNNLSHIKRAKPGDYIVMAGGRVGLDGIHGATFSSESLSSGSPATAVQIGDPITQKKMSDAIINEARGKQLYSSITDDGAGGLSSSVGEMAQATGGCEVFLDNVPLKYPGLAPWQIWISESQERMTLAVPKKKWKAFSNLMKKRGVEANVIGKFTNSGRCVVKYGKQTVLGLEMDFLHNGRPIKHRYSQKTQVRNPDPEIKIADNFNKEVLNLLAQPNIAGFAFISQQYDHEVQGGSVLKPLQGAGRINADSSVTRPILTSKKGVVLSYGLTPSYSEIDSYAMAAAAIDSAVRAAVATGADPDFLALLDNFCWCSSDEPARLAQLKDALKACFDVATIFGTPFISGKDSMYNDFKGFDVNGRPVKISIPPTLLISAIGVVPDVAKTVSLDAKMPGDLIYILGQTHNELGGSEFLKSLNNASPGNNVPAVDAEKNLQMYRAFYKAVQQNLIASAISVSKGGLAVALAKMCAGGNLGATIDIENMPGTAQANYTKLFSESQGRILVSIAPQNRKKFERLMPESIFAKIGGLTSRPAIVINDEKKNVLNLKTADALKAYESTFENF